MLGLFHASSAPVVSRCGAPSMMAADPASLCAALHAGGEPPDGLSEALSTRPKANAFFTEYFKSKLEFDAATCLRSGRSRTAHRRPARPLTAGMLGSGGGALPIAVRNGAAGPV